MFINIKNRTQEFQRIRLIPSNNESDVNLGFENVNPTLSISPDRILSVCLAPTVFNSCENAIVDCDTGGIWGNFIINVNGVDYPDKWDSSFTDMILLNNQSELHFNWTNLTREFLRVEIRSATLYETDDGWRLNSNISREVDFENNIVKFCLSPALTCQPTEPVVFNFEQVMFEVDLNKEFLLFNNWYGEIVQHSVQVHDVLGTDKGIIYLSDVFRNISGFYANVDTKVNYEYQETCNEYQYEGNYYVRQIVQSWENDHYVGPFFVNVNGVKTYLEGSQRNFQHKGNQTTLKEVIKPYYESLVTFLTSFGIDATYDPNLWGSYNSGGLKIIRTAEQYESISFGTDNGYDLLFDGRSDSTCISFKSFDELENGPGKVTIFPIENGEPIITEMTLLGTHETDYPDTQINVLQYLGIFNDISMKSCFGEMPS